MKILETFYPRPMAFNIPILQLFGVLKTGEGGSTFSHTNFQRQSVSWAGRRCCAAGDDGRAATQ
ncbi:MAG: hypothetical protein ABSC89_13485 [Verrucomicrobiota bacterium]